MDKPPRRTDIIQLRRLLRRLDRAHTGDESRCAACGLQQLAMQLVDEIELQSERAQRDELRPGAASVILAIESVIAAIYALGVEDADEQGRVMQALLDYIGDVSLDLLAQDAMAQEGEAPASAPAPSTSRRSGSLH